VKKTMIVLAGLALSAAALAQLSKHKDWGKSPEAYFLTPAERQEWSQIQNDADAEKFIATYWAKRDPNPATANNEFRDEVNRRIAAADEQFKMRRQRGAESARGRLLVVLGAPSRFSQQRAQEADQTPSGVTAPALGTGLNAEQQVQVTWTYDKNKFDPSWDVGEVRARILVDPQGGFDSLQTAGPVDRAIAKIAEKTIVNPSGQVGTAAAPPAGSPASPPAAAAPAPAQPPPAAAARPSAAPSAPAVPPAGTGTPATAAPSAAPPSAGGATVSAALPAATKATLQSILQAKKSNDAAFWGGTFRSIPGEPFYAFQLYVPADKESAVAGGVKLGAVVQNAAGQEVATLWEDATLSEMKTGARTDRVYDKSLVLPPGEYSGSFALFPAAGGEPVAASAAQFTVAPPTGFDVSPLILGNTLTPLTRRPAPTDPFVFGAEKPIRVEPKANRQFTRDDGLWYFYTVSNPTIAEASVPPPPAATPAPSATPGASPAPPGAAASAPSLPAQTARPRIQTRISVMRDGKAAFAPFTGPAEMQPLGSGYYASGSEIPLATFEPGHYTFGILVRDLNAPKDSAANKGVERKEDFIVLLPDGKIPEKAAAGTPAGAKPKPTPKKP
jgi:GWxTD domain-containing protein